MASQISPVSIHEGDIEIVDSSLYEQINGKLIEREVPNLKHGRLQKFATRVLESPLASLAIEVVQEVSINHWDKPKSDWMTPDVIVSLPGGFKEARNGYVLPPILLTVEVLSPRQTIFNMQWKVKELLAWGVQQVWLADPESASIAVFDTPERAELIAEGNMPVPGTEVKVAISDLFSTR